MILIKMNLSCPMACSYCYQTPVREEGFHKKPYDLDAVIRTVRDLYSKTKSQIVVHGGEPLSIPIGDFERLLSLSYELDGKSSIQTNGYLISEPLIALFKKYRTSVGVSIDGPWPCNELRGSGSPEDRRAQTLKILENIRFLRKENIPTSVIAVVHKYNAVKENRLQLLKDFVSELELIQVCGRLNPCCTGNPEYDLSQEEAVSVYSNLFKFMLEKGYSSWSPFKDVLNSLQGKKEVVCVFAGCYPYATPSATTVLYDGSLGVCVRLYQDDIYLRSSKFSRIRETVLGQTECLDCDFFPNCKGGCSGMALDFDWRHKDRFCETYRTLFQMARIYLKAMGCQISRSPPMEIFAPGNHSDGIQHLDGSIRHLDSDIGLGSHTDGIEHLDGETRHLDSG